MPLDITTYIPEETETQDLRKQFVDILRNCPYPKCYGYFGYKKKGAAEPYTVCAVGAILIEMGAGKWLQSDKNPDELMLVANTCTGVFIRAYEADIDLPTLVDDNNDEDRKYTFAQLADRLEQGVYDAA